MLLVDYDVMFDVNGWWWCDVWCDVIVDDEDLKIPHSKLSERSYVLVPMNDICLSYNVPVLNKTINELMLMVDYNDDIIKLYKHKIWKKHII